MIPIVIGAVADPVGVGAVSSFAHPGGNLTGFSTQSYELEEKRFELLREMVPGLGRLVMLGNAANPYSALAMKRIKDLAEAVGLTFGGVDIDAAGGLESGLDKVRRARPDGVLMAAAPAFFSLPHADRRIHGGQRAAGDISIPGIC